MFQGKWDISIEGFARMLVGPETLGSKLGPCPGGPEQEQGVGIGGTLQGRHVGDGSRAEGRETGGSRAGRRPA